MNREHAGKSAAKAKVKEKALRLVCTFADEDLLNCKIADLAEAWPRHHIVESDIELGKNKVPPFAITHREHFFSISSAPISLETRRGCPHVCVQDGKIAGTDKG